MIKDWRQTWGQGDFPFYFVQLANFGPNGMAPEQTWPELREAQTMTLALPNTAMAVAIDIGDTMDIHPRNKQEVGHRLALAAKSQIYGAQGAYSGPMYQSMAIEGDKIRLCFTHTDGGLVAKGSDGMPSTQRALCTFVIAGEDRQFVPAEAKIDGDTVVVWSDAVKQPVAARYAWLNDPQGCNLRNAANLPASPFRTDDWPCVTEGKM
jgi:sialate O-acetylesterase